MIVNDPLHFRGAEHAVVPFLLGFQEIFPAPAVIMNAHAVGGDDMVFMAAVFLHDPAGPGYVMPIGAAENEFHCRIPDGTADGGIADIFLHIHFRGHFPAAAPVFIADAPVFYLKRRCIAVCFPLFCQGSGSLGEIAVFHPIPDVQGHQAGDIGGHIGLCPNQTVKIHEFMGAHLIFFQLSIMMIPPINPHRPLFPGADAIPPIIGFGKASAGPAHNGGIYFFEAFNQLFPKAPDIFHRAFFPYHNPSSITPPICSAKWP